MSENTGHVKSFVKNLKNGNAQAALEELKKALSEKQTQRKAAIAEKLAAR